MAGKLVGVNYSRETCRGSGVYIEGVVGWYKKVCHRLIVCARTSNQLITLVNAIDMRDTKKKKKKKLSLWEF